ncbi:multidrug effflux MFS transporter [Lederbergia wuyishanensis]|uniref:Bcr/CflA family efflux transporter n=1 Tax=Lederbergia wuyishanensis TaxID=1347903 RepID=A0ABU0D654_9BACI|nr:multidrug effflux MFS transporter [Lederbergia wuyishanensis]MCJ8008689.1 multidrug effflux MFS transporter [Lederbergia wuyishanensis]MDQ0343892.1 DHA1 family bicyclomycin/chloramphenicol resistance-like MFS transporter [Lederbergia wuyishanensis]
MNKKNPIRFALLLAAFSALGPFTFDMYLPAFPQLTEFFGTSASAIQVSITACLLGVGVGQIVMGPLSDVHGRRKPLWIAMIVYAIASFGCALSPNIATFIALRFLQGFAASAGMVISRAIVRDLYSGVELTKFFSLLTMIGNLAPLLAPIAGSAVISFSTWNGVFIFLGLLGIFLTSITTWKLKETLQVEKRVPSNFSELLRNFKTLIQNRTFMGYALAQGIMMAGIFAYISGTPFIYQKIYGVSPQVFAMLFAMNGISLIIGAQTVRRLAGRIPESRILLIGMSMAFITSAAVLIVVLSHGPLFSLVIPLFLFVASLGLIGPVTFTLAMESQGHIAGSAAGLLGVLPFLLGSITSPLVGIAGEYSAIPFGVIIFTTSFLAIINYVLLVKKDKTVGASEKQALNH